MIRAINFSTWHPPPPGIKYEALPEVWVLVADAVIRVGATRLPADANADQRIVRDPHQPERAWHELAIDLASLRALWFSDRTDIQIATTDDADSVPYQDVVTAMDVALHTGFIDIRLLDRPEQLPFVAYGN